jgi:hypothetical protein
VRSPAKNVFFFIPKIKIGSLDTLGTLGNGQPFKSYFDFDFDMNRNPPVRYFFSFWVSEAKIEIWF